ncbi:MAG: metal-sulfur cluster assembly factor [Phycisphaerae bacterium]
MAITITQKAAAQLLTEMRKRGLAPADTCLRIKYHKAAPPKQRCSIEFETRDTADAALGEISRCEDIEIRCGSTSRRYLGAITLGYSSEPDAAGFTITKSAAQKLGTNPFAADWIRRALSQVIDPEVGINIVDLGLIYDTQMDGHDLAVTMTMTTPACPMTEMIVSEAKSQLQQNGNGIDHIEVEVVWDPPWTPEMISQEGRRQMGWR